MAQRNDGGPAFPVEMRSEDSCGVERVVWSGNGMTLRDYFAAKAMQSLILDTWYQSQEHAPTSELKNGLASDAYEVADAMLAEREREN